MLGLRAAAGGVGAGPTAPAFHSLTGGLGGLVDALAAALGAAGAEVRLGSPVAAMERSAGGFLVHPEVGPAVTADGVVVAVPAPAAARLIHAISPEAAAPLAALEHASVAVVTLAYSAADVGRPLDGAGFLVPPGEGLLLTACSWASTKWAELASADVALVRASVGRRGDERHLDVDDARLVERVHDDLVTTTGMREAPVDTRVSRWPGSFPQYRPGHLARVEAVEAALARDAPGAAVAGAAYRGIGISTCAAGALAAAGRVATSLGGR